MSLTPDKMRGFVDASNGFEGEYVPKKARELIYEAADEIERLSKNTFCPHCRTHTLQEDNNKKTELHL